MDEEEELLDEADTDEAESLLANGGTIGVSTCMAEAETSNLATLCMSITSCMYNIAVQRPILQKLCL